MTTFELEYRKFERKSQEHKLSNKFQFTTEEVFETLDIVYINARTAHYSTIIEPIVNKNYGNTFHHQNIPNQLQHIHKHTGQQYQHTSFKISKNLSPSHL